MSLAGAYAGRSIVLTGDTGFKGAWLTRWLARLGARVTGLALPPERQHDLFVTAELAGDIAHVDGDIRNLPVVDSVLRSAQPDIVFHLAAQAVVRRGYEEPVETFATNVLGTANVLDSIRRLDRPVAVVVVTSDKCYANQESDAGYSEDDALGGDDIYSASKGAAEIVSAAFRKSYFMDGRVRVATARAGNVIGPGDWADARLIPDAVRALSDGERLAVRNPAHVRPWQHVLEPLSGYLWLGVQLLGPRGREFTEAFNFGPLSESCVAVSTAADLFVEYFQGAGWTPAPAAQAFSETKLLRLRIEKAATVLGWRPVWSVRESLRRTASGYRALGRARSAADVRRMMDSEIDDYTSAAAAAGVPWTAVPGSVDRARSGRTASLGTANRT